jgi:alanine dehydrogenase
VFAVTETTAKKLVTISEVIPLVEAAFGALDRGISKLFPVVSGQGDHDGADFGVKSGLDGDHRVIGTEIGTYWPHNRQRGLENHGSTTLLLDPDTGFLSTIISSSYLTALRTAAADAVAVKYLARTDACSVGCRCRTPSTL